MRKIGFIGAYDKTDLILYLARILSASGKKILFIDSTITQKAKYVVPEISPVKSYVTNFENIDVAVGFEDYFGIKEYLGMPAHADMGYDYAFIDIDDAQKLDSFQIDPEDVNYFITSFDLYSLKKGLEILSALRDKLKLTKVLFTREALQEEDDYLNFLSMGYKIEWDDDIVYFPLEVGDQSVTIENQRVSKIKYKRLSAQYRDNLLYMLEQIVGDKEYSTVKKVYKQLEKEKIMKKVIHKADTRGHSQYDWLDSYHTFSFDEYFDSDRINFGALRVLNDDKVAPGEGFQTHPHKNMEIISIPLKGHLQHGDSKKNSRIITVGEIQTMSAGTGIFHSEVNASPVEPVEFLQIWIMPRERNTHPVYKDFSIKELERPNELAVIVSPDGSTPASLLQDTWFSIGKVEAGKKLGYHLHQSHGGVYIFLIEGEIVVDGEVLKRRDGMGVYDTKSFELETLKDSHILLIEVPM